MAKSKSANNLPEWARDIFDVLIASLIEYYGSSGDLCNLNPKTLHNLNTPQPTTLLNVIQEMVEVLAPRQSMTLKHSDVLYKIVSLPYLVRLLMSDVSINTGAAACLELAPHVPRPRTDPHQAGYQGVQGQPSRS